VEPRCADTACSATIELECEACTIGKYQSAVNSASCISCAVGKYSAALSATACVPCAVGKYGEAEGINQESGCTPCEVGKYQEASGKSVCKSCAAGTKRAASDSASSACVGCDPGQYSGTQASACDACGAGAVTDTAATTCQPCVAGQYSATSTVACEDCEAGTYSGTQAAICDACDVGKYQWRDSCLSCEPGTYQDQPRAISCIDCPLGMYVAATGSSTASDCADAASVSNSSLLWLSPWDAPAGSVYISADSDCIGANSVCAAGPALTLSSTSTEGYECMILVKNAQLPNGTFVILGGSIQSGFSHAAPSLYGAGVKGVPTRTSNSSALVRFSPLYIRTVQAMSVVLEASCVGTHKYGPVSSGMFYRPCDACPAGRYRDDCNLTDTTFRSAGDGTCKACAAGQYKSDAGAHSSVCSECSLLSGCAFNSYRVGCGPTSEGSCATCEFASASVTQTCSAMLDPTARPTVAPTSATPGPTFAPSAPTAAPTKSPTVDGATVKPTAAPTSTPSALPTAAPTPVPCPGGKYQQLDRADVDHDWTCHDRRLLQK
jgi:hypothetical protein